MPQETDAEKITRLEREIERLKREIERLRRALEEAQRAGKRQAAPFSRHNRKANPKKPGRKPGSGYGRAAQRPVPDRVDETREAELPVGCPHCGGILEETGLVDQYQTEIPEPRCSTFTFASMWDAAGVADGGCRGGMRSKPPMPWAARPRKWGHGPWPWPAIWTSLGLSHAKTAAVLEAAFGLRVSRGGLCQAFHRVAQKAEPTYQRLIQVIRQSPSVTADETGWRVNGAS